jgi:hypothetical protein
MHKVTVPYTDWFDDDKSKTETFYFNINAFELAEIAAEFDDDLGEYMRRSFGKDGNYKDGFKVLKLLFIKAYGRRQESVDGSGRMRFVKDPRWIMELLPSPEFEAFYLKLTDDTEFAVSFWNGIVSKELLERSKKIAAADDIKKVDTGTTDNLSELSLEEQLRVLKARNDLLEKTPANEVAAQ